MSRTFEVNVPRVTLPTIEMPWRGGAAIADSLKSRFPNHTTKSTSKLPMLLGAAIIIVVLVIVTMSIKKRRARSSSSENFTDAADVEPNSTCDVADGDEH